MIEKPFPSKGLKFPKGFEKPPFMTFAEVQRRAKKATPAEAADLWECAFLSLTGIDELLQLVKLRQCIPACNPMFVFAAHTGARRSEIIRSTLGDWISTATSSQPTSGRNRTTNEPRGRIPPSALLRTVLQDMLCSHPDCNSTFWHELPPTRGHNRIEPQPLNADTAHALFRRTLAGSK